MFSHGGKTNDAAIDPGLRRRRIFKVALALVAVLGSCVAVPAVLATQWFVKATLDAGTGSSCPGCAVDDYFAYGPLAALGGDDLKFQRTLCRHYRDQLHEQAERFAKTYLEAAHRWNVSPVLGHGAMDGDKPKDIRGGKASITVDVTHSHDAAGGNVVSRKVVTWHFEVVDDDGWRVCSVQLPDVCRDLIVCIGPRSLTPSAAPSHKGWDMRVPYRCLPDRPYHDLVKDCPTPPADWIQPGPYYCAPDQPFGIPTGRKDECATLGWA
jgi:hypothetical protein